MEEQDTLYEGGVLQPASVWFFERARFRRVTHYFEQAAFAEDETAVEASLTEIRPFTTTKS